MPATNALRWPMLGAASCALALGFASGDPPSSSRPVAAVATPAAPADPVTLVLRAELESLPAAKKASPVEKALTAVYAPRAGRPLWSEGGRLLPRATELLEALRAAPARGLDPADYGVDRLERQLQVCANAGDAHAEVRARQLASCDLLLSRAFLEYGGDLAGGQLEPRREGVPWYTDGRTIDLPAALGRAVAGGRIAGTLAELEPQHVGYRRLVAALATLQAVAAGGGWAALPADPKELVADPEGARRLRERLILAGDLAADAPHGPLDVALAAFQGRHGLRPSGKLDAETLAAFNVPVAERIRQVELNLERWRWLPESLGERYVLVNIPDFELELVEHNVPVLTMRVVVGKTLQPTPALSDTIEALELNPYWNVPPSIAEAEIDPAVRKDPGYLAKENMEIVGGEGDWIRYRQRPGPLNSLGRIKFVLPNEHNIYLHDTPAGHLFAREERDFSHGCIRLQAPLDLAERLLAGDPAWSRARLEAEIATGETQVVRLPEEVPVHVLYWTAWVDEDGRLQFRDDLYRIDARLARALERHAPDAA